MPTKTYRLLPVFVPSIIHNLTRAAYSPMAFTSCHDRGSNPAATPTCFSRSSSSALSQNTTAIKKLTQLPYYSWYESIIKWYVRKKQIVYYGKYKLSFFLWVVSLLIAATPSSPIPECACREFPNHPSSSLDPVVQFNFFHSLRLLFVFLPSFMHFGYTITYVIRVLSGGWS